MAGRIFTFNEDLHEYRDDRNFCYTSVTTCVHKYVPVFDRKAHARRLAREGRGQYEGKSEKEILQMWDSVTNHALDKGSGRHNFIEAGVKEASGFDKAWKKISRPSSQVYTIDDILKDHTYGLVDLDKLADLIGYRYPKIWEAIVYYSKKGYRVYSEIVVYDDQYLISGMIDLLLVHPDGHFVIIDWKTNKHDIRFESGYYKKDKVTRQQTDKWVDKREYMLAPLDGLDNCNGNHYAMQLSTYTYLCEKFGLKYEYIILTHIREHYELNEYGRPRIDSNGMFTSIPELGERVEFIPIPYYKSHVRNMFNHHFNKMNGEYGVQFTIF